MKLVDVNLRSLGDDDLLLGVEACSVSVLIRGRNAWYSTWVTHWFHNSSLFSDHRSAQLGAEPMRAPGNVFYVCDVPALLLVGSTTRVVVIDGIRDEPFKHFTGFTEELVKSAYGSSVKGVFPGVTLHEALAAFDGHSEWWRSPAGVNDQVQFGEVPDACDVTLMPRGKFRSSKSHPRGSGYYLGWTATDDSLPKAAARRQAKAWLELLVDVPGVSSTSPIQDLWAIGNSRRLLTRLLKKHNAKRNKTVASADSIRARYHEALDAAETVVHASEAAVDELCEAEEKAQAEVWDAESFAEDPWGSMTHLAVTAAEIRQARERAANAELLLVQAGEKLKATQEALAVAETEWLGALRRYEHLRADPPAQ